MKRKLLYLLIPLIPILIGIVFAFYYTIPRLEYTYSDIYMGYLVSRAFGDSKEYTIPEEYNGIDVVGVSTRAFYKHNSLEKITFEKEENIRFIGKLAFSECHNLKEISVSYAALIEMNAFSLCEKIEEIEISAENIGASAFFGCSSLKLVKLNSGVKTIGSYSFCLCSSLEELTIPETTSIIYNDAFASSGLKLIKAPTHLAKNEYLSTLDFVQYY